MKTNPVQGKTLRWTFSDGPTAGKTFEHVFDPSGSFTYREVVADDDGTGEPTPGKRYEVASLTDDVFLVSYLGGGGYTLTTVLDLDSKRVVAVASNQTSVTVQTGTFVVVADRDSGSPRRAESLI